MRSRSRAIRRFGNQEISQAAIILRGDVVTPENSSSPEADPLLSEAAFAERLKAAIKRKGWSLSETARQVSRLLEEEDRSGQTAVFNDVQGKAVPNRRYLAALCRALELDPNDLMSAALPQEEERAHAADGARRSAARAREKNAREPDGMSHIRDYGDGTALLEIFQRLPWPTAREIMKILEAEKRDQE